VGDVDDSKQSGIGEGGADAPPASECHSSIAGLRPISEYRGGTATGVLEALTRGKERICALVPGLERRGSGGGAGTRAPPSRSWRPPGCAAWSSSLVPAAALRGGEGPTLVAKLPQQAVGLAEHVRFLSMGPTEEEEGEGREVGVGTAKPTGDGEQAPAWKLQYSP